MSGCPTNGRRWAFVLMYKRCMSFLHLTILLRLKTWKYPFRGPLQDSVYNSTTLQPLFHDSRFTPLQNLELHHCSVAVLLAVSTQHCAPTIEPVKNQHFHWSMVTEPTARHLLQSEVGVRNEWPLTYSTCPIKPARGSRSAIHDHNFTWTSSCA